jgi:hypothetical protein
LRQDRVVSCDLAYGFSSPHRSSLYDISEPPSEPWKVGAIEGHVRSRKNRGAGGQSARTGSSHKMCEGRGSQPGRGKGARSSEAPHCHQRDQKQVVCQYGVKSP